MNNDNIKKEILRDAPYAALNVLSITIGRTNRESVIWTARVTFQPGKQILIVEGTGLSPTEARDNAFAKATRRAEATG